MKHESWIFCDNLVSLQKVELTNFLGRLSPRRMAELDAALMAALGLRQ
jgi:mRNA interferase MazF